MSDFISVSVLNNYIKNIIDSEEMLNNIVVAGEITGFKKSGAHAYFNVKDENSSIPGCVFNYARCEYLPKDGESVLLQGSVDFYAKGGKITFIARNVVPLGQGALAYQLELLKKKLLEQGYFEEAKKKPIPKFCKRICVLTAKTGAVIRDIITTTRRKNKIIDIDVYPVKVQGIGADKTIIEALLRVDKEGYDAIIIARGGGSFEDLMPFNSEQLVYAIYKTRTPVISAVGHETDFTLCDFVADIRVPTPTAGAELVAYNVEDLKQQIVKINKRIIASLSMKFLESNNLYRHLTQGIIHSGRMTIEKNRSKIATIDNCMSTALRSTLQRTNYALSNIITRLDANNPIRILKQGYYKVLDDEGKEVIIEELREGDGLNIRGAMSIIKARVENVTLINGK